MAALPAKVFGATLASLRSISILATMGSGIVIFLAVRRYSIGLVGLDGCWPVLRRISRDGTYLDNAHADASMLFVIFLGCHIVDF